jgi:nucleoid DNA-binding protein
MKLELKDIYSQVSHKTGVSKKDVELAFRSMFELVVTTMRAQKGENILLPKMGKFVVTTRKMKFLNHEKYMEQLSRYSGGLEQPDSQESRGRGESLGPLDGM